MDDAPGIKNISMGLTWFFGGSLVTFFTYEAASSSGGYYILTSGAILGGAIQFFAGLIQFIQFKTQSPVDRLLPLASLELKALLRTMIASAENDGPLNDGKIQLVQAVLQKVTGRDEFTSYRIRDVSQAMAKDGAKTGTYLGKVQSDLSLEIKQLIMRTSALLLENGNEGAVRAPMFLREIGQALQLTDQQCADATEGIVQYSVAPNMQSA